MLLYFGIKIIPSPNQVGVVLKMVLEFLLMAEIRQSPVEVGSWNPMIHDGFYILPHSQLVVWDFWTIDSMTTQLEVGWLQVLQLIFASINLMAIFETIDFPPQVVAQRKNSGISPNMPSFHRNLGYFGVEFLSKLNQKPPCWQTII